MNNSLTLLGSTFILGFVLFNLSKTKELLPIINEKEILTDTNIKKLLYEEELTRMANDLVNDIIKDVCDNIKEEEEEDKSDNESFYSVKSYSSNDFLIVNEID